MTDIIVAKAALRAEILALRVGWNPGVGAQLAAHVLASGLVPPDAVVAGFWPMPHEIDIRPLLHALHERGHRICLPETPPRDKPLIFRAWTPQSELVRGRFSTMFPVGEVTVPDFVLVPLVAFDASGHRLGYGGGYYDRTLAELPNAFRLGCAYAAQEVAHVPVEETDFHLHAVATEKGIRPLQLKKGEG
ncbi:MAG TPA: 5-formyltetrahydrofolate cyclo-ligase [Acidocella sp.]|nr:5-formyltetrahydrofolate cyclo-ligase [Acidocella sp.]